MGCPARAQTEAWSNLSYIKDMSMLLQLHRGASAAFFGEIGHRCTTWAMRPGEAMFSFEPVQYQIVVQL